MKILLGVLQFFSVDVVICCNPVMKVLGNALFPKESITELVVINWIISALDTAVTFFSIPNQRIHLSESISLVVTVRVTWSHSHTNLPRKVVEVFQRQTMSPEILALRPYAWLFRVEANMNWNPCMMLSIFKHIHSYTKQKDQRYRNITYFEPQV